MNKIKNYINYIITGLKNPSLLYMEIKNIFSKADITIKQNGFLLVIPSHHGSFISLHEVFTLNVYKSLTGCENVIDLGGFMGESALYLSKLNKNIVVYEANPDNFIYLKKNISHCSNIKGYNLAITGEETKSEVAYYVGGKYNGGGSISLNKSIHSQEILLKNIGNINIEQYDGIKMDIEGAEYSIINYFINKNITFKKGYIEFHEYQNFFDKINIINKYISILTNTGYTLIYYNINGLEINYKDIYSERCDTFVLFFKKNNCNDK